MKVDKKYFESLDNASLNIELRKACHYGEAELAKFIIVEMALDVDKITWEFLNGKNLDYTVHNDVLQIIKVRDTYQNLESSLKENKFKRKNKI